MATKRIKQVAQDPMNDRLRLLYDDGSQGTLSYGDALKSAKKSFYVAPEGLVGLTLKQAKMKLGVK